MPRISASLQVKHNIQLVRRGLENLREALPKIGKARMDETAVEIARRMAKPGKKMTYPAKWASAKQRIKVIIMIMKKQGFLPYVRTHAHERGWKVERNTRGAKVYSNTRGNKQIYGTMRNAQQADMFAGRWPILRVVYDAVVAGLPKKVKESLRKVPRG
jgi:hypothetical protein